MVTAVDAETALVATVNAALVAPAAIVTLAGTLAAVVLLLESVTCAPPAGAGPLNVTVPVDEFPPATLVGFNASEASVAAAGVAGVTVNKANGGFPPLSQKTTTFDGEKIGQMRTGKVGP